MSPLRAAVFDYGGVLTTPVRHTIASWLEADRITPESFSRTLRSWLSRSAPDGTPIHRLETGELGTAEFERLLAAELTTYDGSPVLAEGLLTRLFREMGTDAVMIGLVREIRSSGVRTVLLSNSWGNTYPRELIAELFDGVVISGEVGLRKPDPKIYHLALDQIGAAAAESVFIDDAEPNIEAAAALGMHTVHHAEPAVTRRRLAELIPGLAAAPDTSSPLPRHAIQ